MSSADTGVELEAELRSAISTGDVSCWAAGVGLPGADPFLALSNDRSLCQTICDAVGFSSLNDWILAAPSWVDSLHRPGVSIDPPANVLRIAWESVTIQLGEALRQARVESLRLPQGALPREGGVLAFVDGLELCLVLRYRFVGDAAELGVVATIPHPRSAFDIVDDLIRQDHPTRNALKGMLQSSHRLIWHRGILGHVDRRFEPTVFGPSIDTLYIAEILARRFRSQGAPSAGRVLEVGTGSGFVLAGLMRNLHPEYLVGMDSDPAATSCTARNLAINAGPLARASERPPAVVLSPFRSGLLDQPFDLVVCNPPYIPEPPGRKPTTLGDRGNAVAGLSLIDSLLDALPGLLAPTDGEMLLMVSSVTPPAYVAERLPAGFELSDDTTLTRPRSVLFEVEEIFDLPVHVRFLEQQGGVHREGTSYMHDLRPLWIRRSGGSDA